MPKLHREYQQQPKRRNQRYLVFRYCFPLLSVSWVLNILQFWVKFFNTSNRLFKQRLNYMRHRLTCIFIASSNEKDYIHKLTPETIPIFKFEIFQNIFIMAHTLYILHTKYTSNYRFAVNLKNDMMGNRLPRSYQGLTHWVERSSSASVSR